MARLLSSHYLSLFFVVLTVILLQGPAVTSYRFFYATNNNRDAARISILRHSVPNFARRYAIKGVLQPAIKQSTIFVNKCVSTVLSPLQKLWGFLSSIFKKFLEKITSRLGLNDDGKNRLDPGEMISNLIAMDAADRKAEEENLAAIAEKSVREVSSTPTRKVFSVKTLSAEEWAAKKVEEIRDRVGNTFGVNLRNKPAPVAFPVSVIAAAAPAVIAVTGTTQTATKVSAVTETLVTEVSAAESRDEAASSVESVELVPPVIASFRLSNVASLFSTDSFAPPISEQEEDVMYMKYEYGPTDPYATLEAGGEYSFEYFFKSFMKLKLANDISAASASAVSTEDSDIDNVSGDILKAE